MNITKGLILLFVIAGWSLSAQNITGKVYGYFGSEKEPIFGASVYYVNSETATTTNKNGWFEIEFKKNRALIIQYIGFKPDTIRLFDPVFLDITMRSNDALNEIVLTERIKATELNKKSANLEFNIGKKELAKAACCNLSESFETNPAIDASFADAVTGTRQIELLGLAGKYSQIQIEMTPYVRGISSNYGLTHIPGPWIQSLQLSKGAGSVVNGFESMTGQINIEFFKPESGPSLYLNTYGNASGRAELNLITAQKLSEKWSTLIMAHTSGRFLKNDVNNDGFLDMPLNRQYNLTNKWKYSGKNGFNSQIGVRVLSDVMQGGQTTFDHNDPINQIENKTSWGSEIKNERYELFGKAGYILPNVNLSSIGFIYSISHHNLNSYFGSNNFDASQTSFYGNLLYQSIINTSEHQYKVGASFVHDQYQKDFPYALNETGLVMTDFANSVPGAFVEYTWNPNDNFSMIAGARADYHEKFDVFVSPRLHMRYNPFEKTTFRLGAGKGYRLPNFFEENLSILASSRVLQNTTALSEAGYQMESSWNYGLSIVQEFRLNYMDGSIIIDFFHTQFDNQLVRDLDVGPQQYLMYYLSNGSRSSTLSAQFDYELVKRLDVRLAYKYQNVTTDFKSIGSAMVPLIPQNRVLVNLAYETRNNWKFDVTWNTYDQKRIPTTTANPGVYQMERLSPSYGLVNFQVNKTMGQFEVYVGGENIFNLRQDQPIIAADDPYGQYFDSNLVWGPIFGRMFYLGINFNLAEK